MQSLLYYIAAVIAAVAVVVFALKVTTDGEKNAVNATQVFREKKRLMTAVQMIELDFRNLGAGVDSVEHVFPTGLIDTTSCKTLGGQCRFTFRGRVDSTNTTVSQVSYRWIYTGTDEITDQKTKASVAVPVIELYRGIDGAENTLQWDHLTKFRITMFDSSGTALTSSPESTRQIHVELQALVPQGVDNELEVMRWANWFRPVNLTRWSS